MAENAGGPHCLLYGLTSNHVLALEVVLADGQVVQMGSAAPDQPGYDLRGVEIGSEGTLGIVTKITVRLMPKPEDARTLVAIYDSLEEAGATVSDLIAQGIVPAALEIMDHLIIRAVEAAVHVGYPDDAEAVLLIEVDGLPDGLDELATHHRGVCRKHQARDVRLARTEEERALCGGGAKGQRERWAAWLPTSICRTAPCPRSRVPEACTSSARWPRSTT